MAIIENVELFWVKCDPERPDSFKGGPLRWTIQIRFKDKKLHTKMKEYGFSITPELDDDGNLMYYRTTASRKATKTDPITKEDTGVRNSPVQCILRNGAILDPKTIGNGSVANVRVNVFTRKDGEIFRTLEGIQVVKLIKYTPNEEGFELSEDFEVIDPSLDEDLDKVF